MNIQSGVGVTTATPVVLGSTSRAPARWPFNELNWSLRYFPGKLQSFPPFIIGPVQLGLSFMVERELGT